MSKKVKELSLKVCWFLGVLDTYFLSRNIIWKLVKDQNTTYRTWIIPNQKSQQKIWKWQAPWNSCLKKESLPFFDLNPCGTWGIPSTTEINLKWACELSGFSFQIPHLLETRPEFPLFLGVGIAGYSEILMMNRVETLIFHVRFLAYFRDFSATGHPSKSSTRLLARLMETWPRCETGRQLDVAVDV